jgi:hypothetical protein
LKGVELPIAVIVVIIFLIVLFAILLIWNYSGFRVTDLLLGNYTHELPSNISGGRI